MLFPTNVSEDYGECSDQMSPQMHLYRAHRYQSICHIGGYCNSTASGDTKGRQR